MDARDYLRLAERLVTGSTEAEWRSAVSRAYYSSFHVARRLLLNCGFGVPHADRAHAYLWRRLANCGDTEVRDAGNVLNFLRGERNQADYDFDQPSGQRDAATRVQRAREIILALEKVAKEPLKTQIIEAMKTYERDILKEVTWHS